MRISEEIQFEAHIFLSCFVEQHYIDIDAEAWSTEQYLDLLFSHFMFNPDAFGYDPFYGNRSVPDHFAVDLSTLQNQMNKLFGKQLSDKDLSSIPPLADERPYYSPFYIDGSNVCRGMASDGNTLIYDIAVVDSITRHPDGHQTMKHKIYRIDLPDDTLLMALYNDGIPEEYQITADDYRLTPQQAENSSKFRLIGEGTLKSNYY